MSSRMLLNIRELLFHPSKRMRGFALEDRTAATDVMESLELRVRPGGDDSNHTHSGASNTE